MTDKYQFKFSKAFNKSLSKLDNKTKEQVERIIINFLSNARTVDVIKLKGYKDLYRLRSGDYRIIFRQYDKLLLILFIDVKHRKDVYREL